MGIYEELVARGLIAQVTNEDEIREMINNGKATFYIGFDCTADSLTAGHFMALTLMKRLQMAGNKPIALIGGGTDYKVYKNGSLFAEVQLIVPGRHNVLNSLGALVCAVEMGIKTDSILKALKEFTGAHRRFETKGRVNGVWVVDDYAHHPTEIGVTLKAALQTKPQRLICVFQPHRYTRTQLLFNEFCACFKGCDKLIVTDIYAASEDPIEGVNSQKLAEGIKETSGVDVEYVPSMADIENYLAANARTGDLVMTIGAGDVYKVGEALVADLQRSNENV